MNEHKGQKNIAHTEATKDYEMSFGFFVKKTEKLTTAIYMVTDIISDKEPMRWKIREEAMNLRRAGGRSLGRLSISDR